MSADPSDRSPSLETLYWECSGLDSPQKRSEWLKQRCPNEPALHAKVEHMFAVEADADRFAEAFFPMLDLEEKQDPYGQTIGPYKLLQEIGRGGMGVVYMAEQSKPVARRVALKVVKPGMDSDEVVARFEAERQTLAMMDHPNIAKVLDAGQTVTGRPYFVMELIQGLPITDYADDQRLGLRQRIELVIQACRGIQHAHQKGIIHRDIKPSNVLVSLHDEQPVVKIIDFGVAKALDYRLNDKTLFTRFGQVVGTLEYMSPEQAQWNQLDIDTRTDVYAVGVLLYELLTGKPPLDATRVRSAAFEEVLRLIREEEPIRPSLKLSTSRRAARLNREGQEPTNQFASLVRGELDWITIKALAKNRDQRYDSVTALADDLQRFLSQEPVLACPPSNWYRWKKTCQRHRTLLLITSLVLLALIGITLSTLIQNQRVRAASDLAIQRLEESQKARQEASQLAEFLLDLFRSPDAAERGEDVQARELLNEAADALLADTLDESSARAALCEAIGDSLASLETNEKSIRLLEEAVRLRKGTDGPDARETLHAQFVLAKVYDGHGRVDDTLALLRQTFDLQKKHLSAQDFDTLTTQLRLANAISEHHGDREGLRLAHEAMELLTQRHTVPGTTESILERCKLALALTNAILSWEENESAIKVIDDTLIYGGSFEGRKLQIYKASLLNNFSLAHYQAGRLAEATEKLEAALEIHRKWLSEDHPALLASMHNLAILDASNGNLDRAILGMKEIIAKASLRNGENSLSAIAHQVQLVQFLIAASADEGITTALKTREHAENILGIDHPLTIQALGGLQTAYVLEGQWVQAAEIGQTILTRVDSSDKNANHNRVLTVELLAKSYVMSGKVAEGKELVRRMLQEAPESASDASREALASLLHEYIIALTLVGQLEQAMESTVEIRHVLSRVPEERSGTMLGSVLNALGQQLLLADRFDAAEPVLSESLQLRELHLPDDWRAFNTASVLGEARFRLGKLEEAEPLLVRGATGLLERLPTIAPEHRFRIEEAIQRLIALYTAKGTSSDLERWNEELHKLKTANSGK